MITTLPPTNNGGPDSFVLIQSDFGYHILAGWSRDEWRLSTPLVSAKIDNEIWDVTTKSGSSYLLDMSRYGFTHLTKSIFNSFHLEAAKKDTCFRDLDENAALATLLGFTP